MNSLLAIEWLKIRNYRTFWVITLLFAAMFFVWMINVSSGVLRVGPGVNVLGSAETFAGVWNSVTGHASNFILFMAILVAILVTNEYNYKTNRQNVIDGWSRLQFYNAKWLVIALLAVATTIFVFLNGIVMGLSKDAMWEGFSNNIIRLLWMFLQSLNYFGFALLLSHLFKRSGLTIGILVIYCYMIEMMLHFYFFFFKQAYAGDLFLPLQCSDQLLQLQSLEQLQKMGLKPNHVTNNMYAIASLCWISFYYFIGRFLVLRRDW